MARAKRAERHFLDRLRTDSIGRMKIENAFATPSLAPDLSRRGFLRGAALAGGGVVVASVAAACTPAATTAPWVYGPVAAPNPTGQAAPSQAASPEPGATHNHGGPGASPAAGDHDANAAAVVKRFLDGEAAAVEGM